MKHTLLLVDDEPDNVDALERLFRKKYHVLKATSGPEALNLLKENNVSLIISDQRMPTMTGVQFLLKSQDLRPDAIRILLTGYTDVESVIDAINSGQIYKYITKPWDSVDLVVTVDKAIEKYELSAELKEKNIALEKALAELKSLDQAKNQFMILINHELKTPLTVMLSYLQLLEDTTLSEEQDKFLARVHTAALRLETLINDALELVSAETRLTKISPKKMSVESLVEPIDERLIEAARNKGQTFKFDLGSKNIVADQNIVRGIVRRILDNAIKFGDSNSEIVVASDVDEAGRTRLSITNKGKSLPPATIAKILKPFTLDENVMNHTQGTGLGLSICRALLEAHGSHLEILSPRGEVKVQFSLPGK